MINWC